MTILIGSGVLDTLPGYMSYMSIPSTQWPQPLALLGPGHLFRLWTDIHRLGCTWPSLCFQQIQAHARSGSHFLQEPVRCPNTNTNIKKNWLTESFRQSSLYRCNYLCDAQPTISTHHTLHVQPSCRVLQLHENHPSLQFSGNSISFQTGSNYSQFMCKLASNKLIQTHLATSLKIRPFQALPMPSALVRPPALC